MGSLIHRLGQVLILSGMIEQDIVETEAPERASLIIVSDFV